jgi:hypothetical protein
MAIEISRLGLIVDWLTIGSWKLLMEPLVDGVIWLTSFMTSQIILNM